MSNLDITSSYRLKKVDVDALVNRDLPAVGYFEESQLDCEVILDELKEYLEDDCVFKEKLRGRPNDFCARCGLHPRVLSLPNLQDRRFCNKCLDGKIRRGGMDVQNHRNALELQAYEQIHKLMNTLREIKALDVKIEEDYIVENFPEIACKHCKVEFYGLRNQKYYNNTCSNCGLSRMYASYEKVVAPIFCGVCANLLQGKDLVDTQEENDTTCSICHGDYWQAAYEAQS